MSINLYFYHRVIFPYNLTVNINRPQKKINTFKSDEHKMFRIVSKRLAFVTVASRPQVQPFWGFLLVPK